MEAKQEQIDSYDVVSDGIVSNIKILRVSNKFTMVYHADVPVIDAGTRAILSEIRTQLIREESSKIQRLSESTGPALKIEFLDLVTVKLKNLMPGLSDRVYITLSATLLHEMFGLGVLEILDMDANLEEIVVNDSKTNVMVYHRKYGWLETNIRIETENRIESYAEQIARKVGRQITTLSPLLDAQLINGDRVNATLFPVSFHGNTLDIRKFRAEPWTIVDFLRTKTLSPALVAFVWQAIQYELSMIVTGGTASGKTSLLNVFMPFIPPNQRIITIEDTNELVLPNFLHWVPLVTRQPNSEGKGQVTMLDLLINSLRMRPDRIVVGEIRKKDDAETLFEALMTGHSVYATLHAETAQQVVKRLLSEPINLPDIEISALDLIITAFRQRKSGKRRVLELAEVTEHYVAGKMELKTNNLFEWKPRTDQIERTINVSQKIENKLELYSGLTHEEVKADLDEKELVLNWLAAHNVNSVNKIGQVASTYYTKKEELMKIVSSNGDPEQVEMV
ncbi:MAG: type II/IV secretion system ATPase subunit [Candidatus Parvarchaeota archaeon]|nr:type II/IV secretion system ATPase subunit [Candidatus Parvarchaeota archaeon]